ncbi:Uncharacterised protein [Serratia quinivorans]|uniref:hypothetical protein n=1 Tax=Serratia quinivorans TaxID=137545 RepID=UPI00217A1FB2|nr:hypothetical protein [Serratia quinivorans]CAI1821600.1 Uncharacterised protein [Serratia quinivorans]
MEEETFNFDLKRMEECLKGPFYTMPAGMTREERHKWVSDCASGMIEPDKESNNR